MGRCVSLLHDDERECVCGGQWWVWWSCCCGWDGVVYIELVIDIDQRLLSMTRCYIRYE